MVNLNRRHPELTGSTKCVRHPLNRVLVRLNKHDRDSRDLSNSALQISITRCNNVATVLLHPIANAVVGVRSFVKALQSFHTRISGDLHCEAILSPKLLKFGHHAVGDAWYAFCKQAVHHRLVDLQLVLDRKVDEVRIKNNLVRRSKLSIVLEV